MKAIAVSTIDGEILIHNQNIVFQQNSMNTYDIPFKLAVTINNNVNTLEKGKVYKIAFMGIEEPIILTLYEINRKIVNNLIKNEYVFIHNDFYKLIFNKVMPQNQILSIKFNQCLINGSNQFEYFLNKIRQKSLFLALNKNLQVITKFVNSVNVSEDSTITSNRVSVKRLMSFEFYKKNYYTIDTNNKIHKTKRGVGTHIYLPFVNKNDIVGLDIYLIPMLQIETTESNFLIGNTVLLDKERYVISHIEQIYTTESKKFLLTLSKNVKELKI